MSESGAPAAAAPNGQNPAVVGTDAGTNSSRGVALLVSGIVLAGGLLYLLGMLIVEEPRWRRAATRTVRGVAVTWRTALAHVVHPIHPRHVRLRPGLR